MQADWTILAAYAFGLFLLYGLAKVLLVPVRLLGRLIGNAILGGLMIGVVDLAGMFLGLFIPINPLSALVVGFLGIPGVILLIILHYLTI